GALAEAENRPAAPEGSALGRFAANAGAFLNPVTMVTGLYESVKSPEAVTQTLERIVGASAAEGRKAVDACRQGRYSEMLGHGAAMVPVLGPAAAAAREQIAGGDVAGGLGAGGGRCGVSAAAGGAAAVAGEQIAGGDVAGGLGTGVGLVGSILAPGAVKAAATTPVVRAVTTPIATALEGQAVRLARAGVKAPLALLKQQAGASMEGVNVGANRLAKFLIDNRITTPGQATRIVKNTEAELQRILAAKGQTPTDAPQRALLYLDILEQQAAEALKPDHAATVRAAAAELIDTPLGETVTTTVMRPSPTGLSPAGGAARVEIC